MGLVTIVDIGINTHQEPMVYIRGDCEVCMAEGISASTWIGLKFQNRTLISTFNIVLELGSMNPSMAASSRR